MKYFCLGLVIGFLLGNVITSYSDRIPSPPPLKENSVVYQYLFEIYENFHRLQVVTSNPDGSRRGKKGDMLLLQTGGTSYLQINSDSSTEWRGVALSDTP